MKAASLENLLDRLRGETDEIEMLIPKFKQTSVYPKTMRLDFIVEQLRDTETDIQAYLDSFGVE